MGCSALPCQSARCCFPYAPFVTFFLYQPAHAFTAKILSLCCDLTSSQIFLTIIKCRLGVSRIEKLCIGWIQSSRVRWWPGRVPSKLLCKIFFVVQLIPMILSGTAPLYLLSTMYVVAGALLGAPAGVEFREAVEAVKQVWCNPQVINAHAALGNVVA